MGYGLLKVVGTKTAGNDYGGSLIFVNMVTII